MEGSGLDLTDVVHAQIPREKEGGASLSKYQSMYTLSMFFEGTWGMLNYKCVERGFHMAINHQERVVRRERLEG